MAEKKPSNPAISLIITAVLVAALVGTGVYLSRYIALPDFLSVFKPSPWSDMHRRYHFLKSEGEFEKAEKVIREALVYARDNHGRESWQTCISLTDLTECLMRMNRYEDAIASCEEALQLAKVAYTVSKYQIVRNQQNMGKIHYYMEQYDDAEKWFIQARETLTTYEADAEDVANTLDWLAAALTWQDRHDESIPIYEEMLQLYGDSVYFAEEITRAHSNMATCYARIGDLETSERVFKDALASAEKYFEKESQEYGRILLDMADLHNETERYTSAEKLYRQSIELLKKLPDPSYPSAGTAMGQLAEYYSGQDKNEEVIKTYREMLTWNEETHGEMSLSTLFPHYRLGDALEAAGSRDEALLHYRRAVDIVESARDASDLEKKFAYKNLAEALEEVSELEEAAFYRLKAEKLTQDN